MFSMLSLYSSLWLIMILVSSVCIASDDFDVNLSAILDHDDLRIFNRSIDFKTSTVRNYDASKPSRILPTIPIPYTPATSFPIVAGRDGPSYAPPNRNSFTPALPPQYLSPFADRPTLRGSDSDSIPYRRPILPPSVSKIPSLSEQERIPIKPPDLAMPDTKKKSINTSVQKLPETLLNYSEPSSSSPTSTTHKINDTFDYIIPMVHNISSPSVFRILDNGNKHDYLGGKPRLDEELKTKTEHVLKNLNPAATDKSAVVSKQPEVTEQENHSKEHSPFVINRNNVAGDNQDNAVNKDQQITEGNSIYNNNNNNNNDQRPSIKSVQQSTELTTSTVVDNPEPRIRYILGIAWDIHVYLIATLFAILTCVSIFSLCRIASYKWLLPRSYFFTVHILLIAIGLVRSLYLFYDAYNIGKKFSEPISRTLFNAVFPCLIALFCVMFVFILKTVDVKIGYYYVRKTYLLLPLAFLYVALSIFNYLYAHLTPYFSTLMLIGQSTFIGFCLLLSVTYIYLYKYISHASIRKPNSVYSVTFADPFRTSLAHALRVILATSLLSLLMAAIQLIGMFCIYEPYGKDQPHPWLWWAFQLSVRVIEISICFLISWAAVQPTYSDDEKDIHGGGNNSGFALFSWGSNTPRGESEHHGNAVTDDIYPTICNANQAIHNYSLRTGKQVYEDIYPLNNLHHSANIAPTHLLSHTADRRSIKRHPLDEDNRSNTFVSYTDRGGGGGGAGVGGIPNNPSPSMLVDENGIVRFRSFTDADPLPEELFTRGHLVHSMDEYGT